MRLTPGGGGGWSVAADVLGQSCGVLAVTSGLYTLESGVTVVLGRDPLSSGSTEKRLPVCVFDDTLAWSYACTVYRADAMMDSVSKAMITNIPSTSYAILGLEQKYLKPSFWKLYEEGLTPGRAATYVNPYTFAAGTHTMGCVAGVAFHVSETIDGATLEACAPCDAVTIDDACNSFKKGTGYSFTGCSAGGGTM